MRPGLKEGDFAAPPEILTTCLSIHQVRPNTSSPMDTMDPRSPRSDMYPGRTFHVAKLARINIFLPVSLLTKFNLIDECIGQYMIALT